MRTGSKTTWLHDERHMTAISANVTWGFHLLCLVFLLIIGAPTRMPSPRLMHMVVVYPPKTKETSDWVEERRNGGKDHNDA